MQPLSINRQSELVPNKQQSTDIKEGQIVHGKVLKIHPNQTAEVQIGNMKMTAVLEAPLKVGERYWLQASIKGGVLTFKALDEAPSSLLEGKESAIKLLQHLNISESKNSIAVAQLFLKKNLPLTKDGLMTVIGWLDTSKNIEKSTNIVQFMFKNELPVTKDVFLALQSLDKNKNFHSMISTLLQQLTTEDSEVATALKNLLIVNHSSQEKQLGEKLVFQLLKNAVNPENTENKNHLSALQKLGIISPTVTGKELTNKLIETVNHITSNIDKASFPNKESLQIVGLTNQAIANKSVDQVGVALNNFSTIAQTSQQGSIAEELQSVVKNLQSQPLQESENVLIKISQRLLSEALSTIENNLANTSHKQSDYITRIVQSTSNLPIGEMENLSVNIGKMLISLEDNNADPVIHQKLSQSDWNQLAKLVQEDIKMMDISIPESAAINIKKLIGSIGLDFENRLFRLNTDPELKNQELDTIKPLLMKLIQETQSHSVREAAEQVLHRITAQQILTHEAGPLQNIIAQIPLDLAGFKTDMTMQWSGRKNKDGKIDPDYCRVLFYLRLEQIDETVVDMQIQKKIISVTVYNDRSEFIKQLAQPLIPKIKENFNTKGFTLTSVSFESPKKENEFLKMDSIDNQFMASRYSGVDLKI
ncbi:hypothetical protein [Peribacillus acanthi]|uniref:hypothetical protein n=1 Tax=Peribacillus acanthi TaxID=2171554 RepID=UPI000D3E57C6|nr:hypothetical protein [Peribacillus acanthi]